MSDFDFAVPGMMPLGHPFQDAMVPLAGVSADYFEDILDLPVAEALPVILVQQRSTNGDVVEERLYGSADEDYRDKILALGFRLKADTTPRAWTADGSVALTIVGEEWMTRYVSSSHRIFQLGITVPPGIWQYAAIVLARAGIYSPENMRISKRILSWASAGSTP